MNWIYESDNNFHYGGEKSYLKFQKEHQERKDNYPILKKLNCDHSQIIKDKGYVIIKNVVSEDLIEILLEEFEESVDDGEVKNNDRFFTTIKDPLLNCPSIMDVVKNDNVFDTVSGFFGCTPSIGTLNFRRSYVNKEDPVSTQLFHCDQNSVSFLKCFLYLNDVHDKLDGPLTIIPDSLEKKPTNWSSKYRWSEDEMLSLYGKDCMTYLTASAGDIIITRATTAYHRGTPPINKNRTMLTVNFTIHPEDYKPIEFKISYEENNNLEKHHLGLTDFLLKVKI